MERQMCMEEYILEMRNITKAFLGNKVLDDVTFQLLRGEVHALVGANGAGKSTLMKIMNGIYDGYSGEIMINGETVQFKNPHDANGKGIVMVHQELDLAENLDVSTNIFLGREILGNRKFLDRKSMYKKAQKLLDELNFPINAHDVIESLPLSKRQLVMIARCVSMDADIIVFDEPTSSLSSVEVQELFHVIRNLNKRGVSIVYISHFLEEIFQIADHVTVLRNGQKILTEIVSNCNIENVVEWMIGHKQKVSEKRDESNAGSEVILSVRELNHATAVTKNISFDLHQGEVLGITGVVGSGRSELVRMIVGADARASGEISVGGKVVNIKAPSDAVALKIGYLPEDRKEEGLILERSIEDNLVLAVLSDYTKNGFILFDKVYELAAKMIGRMHVKCHAPTQRVADLSGGNQQKIAIGKWLCSESRIIILDQPTRGVDVGAKEEIYQIIKELSRQKVAIILISDEIEEILNLSDRIKIIVKGEFKEELDNRKNNYVKADLLAKMVSTDESA